MENVNPDLLKEIAQENPILDSNDDFYAEDDIYAFISLDLTNSTIFKNEQPSLWKKVIASFYDVIFEFYGINQYKPSLKKLQNQSNDIDVEFWKFIGDEVLLYVTVCDCKELYDIVKATDEAIQKIMSRISNKIASSYKCQNSCSESNNEYECPFYQNNIMYCNIETILKNSLGVKATIWLAICGREDKNRNIIHTTSSEPTDLFQNATFDFLGPEIDEGFRLAKYAVKNRIVVSPFLANALYYSSRDKDFQIIAEKNFKIVSYQKLKGIWRDRLFPIIMYFPSPPNIHEYLEYDEIELPTYSALRINGFNGERCKITYLEKIFKDVHLENEANEIVHRLKDEHYKTTEKKFTTPFIELHIACAIFNKEGLLMIHEHKKRGWEFGCIHIAPVTNTWKKAIMEGYKKKYGLNVLVPDNPIPIATYTYQKYENTTALGIIVLGDFLSSDKENDFKPMTIEQINELNGVSVTDFKINSQKAFDTYSKRTNEIK